MPSDAPLITVIIPAYNRAATIGRALTSVFRQTCTNYEILLVDDGSSDDTAALARAFAHPALRIIRHEHNRGAAAGRNSGLRAARGAYIALLDSDDEWVPSKLATQLAHLQRCPPDTPANCTAYAIWEGPMRRDYFPRPVTAQTLLMGCDLSPGSTLMMKRAVVDEVGLFDETLARYEDWDWLLRYTRVYRIGVLAEPLAIVHYSPHRAAGVMATAAARLLEKYDAELRAAGAAGRKARGLRWMEVARSYAMEREPRAFLNCTARALRAYPLHRPGALLLLVDAWLGTRFAARLQTWRARRRRAPPSDPGHDAL
ncbi:glycosyltransferase family A protein [uncultured Thiodictyon sp.]|jgi:glycosyltransferase involved in cell wall biosynthesis|uniref:glycosyltransferase family 2 protein n=1 Tax=uncultured Thiodictyon sp. TaxID=1846217 RepID=UPI0025D34EA4|nr:glycosyltransferase family A protein [uncultured Thiodictyon sp.]